MLNIARAPNSELPNPAQGNKYGENSHLPNSKFLQTISESSADLSLAAALRVMAPLVELLLREGLTQSRFVRSAKINDSSVSTLTGIHRKDVREWRWVGQPLPQAKSLGPVMEFFTRWAKDPTYRDQQGRPRALDRVGEPGTFEALGAFDVLSPTDLSRCTCDRQAGKACPPR